MTEKKYTINDLHVCLFETLEALCDKKNPMDIERAKAIQQVAQTIVNAGRLECYFLDIVGGTGTGFITDADDEKPLGADSGRMKLVGSNLK